MRFPFATLILGHHPAQSKPNTTLCLGRNLNHGPSFPNRIADPNFGVWKKRVRPLFCAECEYGFQDSAPLPLKDLRVLCLKGPQGARVPSWVPQACTSQPVLTEVTSCYIPLDKVQVVPERPACPRIHRTENLFPAFHGILRPSSILRPISQLPPRKVEGGVWSVGRNPFHKSQKFKPIQATLENMPPHAQGSKSKYPNQSLLEFCQAPGSRGLPRAFPRAWLALKLHGAARWVDGRDEGIHPTGVAGREVLHLPWPRGVT